VTGLVVGGRCGGCGAVGDRGYGLSFTTFRFSDLNVRPSASTETPSTTDDADHPRSRGWTVTARVTNTGSRVGAEVAQLYVGAPAGAQEPPRQLKAYTKVTLKPGQTKTVRLQLPRTALAAWNDSDTGWTVAKGQYQIYVGDSSRNLPLQAGISG
jgi:beta-glucosidase